MPNLKYPANPPAVGDPDTVGQRTATYLCLLAASLVIAFAAWELWERLTARGIDGGERFALVAGAYLAAVTLAWVLFPANPDPLEVPANLIWHFRIQSLGGNAILWVVIGTTFGILADRATSPERAPAGDVLSHRASVRCEDVDRISRAVEGGVGGRDTRHGWNRRVGAR